MINSSVIRNVGIVIPFYNGISYLPNLMKSISSCHEPNLRIEVVVIDNSTINYDSKLFDGFGYVRTAPAIGFGSACNVGYKHFVDKRFDFVIFSNQDGYFDPKLIINLVTPLYSVSSLAITAPIVFEYSNKEIESFFVRYYLSSVPELVASLIKGGDLKSVYFAEAVSGACIAIPVDNEIFGESVFDETYFMYHEDDDLCRRVLAKGKKLAIVPNAFFYHQHSHTSDHSNKGKIEDWKRVSGMILRMKTQGRNRVVGFYGIVVDEMFDSFKLLFRFRFGQAFHSVKLFMQFVFRFLRK